ncbi:LLM class flavin-dependent oxidoreductase [Streptomyces roseicoloratus]|uniref:LLM class flavin-dependent oxidoreductase n=1 Tax=Streptomyces roseicoloratus TaxID=2508722 RepID=A0ABY9RQT9_9ACTN|nr:LLM class flavin-dependent oxidoreductase [Streptomyces roseicoloratus]WMX44559.1 LLM class flavin-dependent oxidoreductase [Streptomyces roseicoloratus]
MLIGVGLPATVPGAEGERITDWARRAEGHGFSTLGVLDRLVYDSYDPLVALTAAAAVTRGIGLATTVLTAPYRNNTPLLAKQVASLDRVSGGRLTLGLAAGNRDDDFTTSGVDPAVRGKLLDAMLAELRDTWRADGPGGVGPAPQGELPLILGGTSRAAFRRTAQYGRGWIAGGSSPSGYRANAEQVEAAWRRHGRSGRPHLMTLLYFSLGPRAEWLAQRYLMDYYAFSGRAESIVTMALTEPSRLRAAVTAYQDAGCAEIVFMPCDAGPDQLDRLADAVL